MDQNNSNNKFAAVKVSCPLCNKVFPEHSGKVFNIAHDNIDIKLEKKCPRCNGSINQHYWTEKGADGEIRLCIGNHDDVRRPITTLSGMLTTNGVFDPKKLKIFKRQGLDMKIFNSSDEAVKDLINDF